MSFQNRLAMMVSGLAVGVAALNAGAAVGPDVVVSGIGATLTKYGTKNLGTTTAPIMVTGYAVTTVSCNIGDFPAVWYDTFTGQIDSIDNRVHQRNEHPVIGTQLYRLSNGRFEQIGMSWLKHGFCAQDAPNCLNLGPPGAVTAINTTCDWLGLYETDTYGAGLNGQQDLCGPRSEVNGSTGAYPYPYVLNWGLTGDCVYKRLQVYNDDLNPTNFPGARFFAEVHYVTTDESAANRLNNASYREATVGTLSNGSTSGGCTTTVQGYPLTFTGATIPLKPAIEAWKTADSTVNLAYVDIPGDGRVIVASKVLDLGGGQWSYEYAVYNHNSNLAVSGFSIPKSNNPSAVFSNIGFHDVAYHSGEPYDGTDWPVTVAAASISWATSPFSVNPNANAIRWSTLYNFRFRSNQPPVAGSVTLGLFKSGGTIDVPNVQIPTMLPPVLCAADFNHSGGSPTVQDIFDFLAAYFANDPSADFNGANGLSVQDIFDFLAAYFTPCP